MAHHWVLETLLLNSWNSLFRISFQNCATKTKLTDKQDSPPCCNCFQCNNGWRQRNTFGQCSQNFTRRITHHRSSSYNSQIFKNRTVKVCFQQTCIGWLPNDFPRQLLWFRFRTKLLEVRQMLLRQLWDLLKVCNGLIDFDFVSPIPNKLANHDETFSSTWILQRQPEKINKK